MTFEEFHQKYTLHDSYWIGIFFNVAYEQTATLAIAWDAVWLPDRLKQSTSKVRNWPYLFIQLSQIEQLSTTNYGNNTEICRAIAGSEIQEIEEKKWLAIDDAYGGRIDLIYRGEAIFLAIEKNRAILEI